MQKPEQKEQSLLRRLVHTLRGHTAEINRIAWSPDGNALASSSFDNTVRIWDGRDGTELYRLQGHKGPVYSVAWAPDGKMLASCSQDTDILLWDVSKKAYLSSPVGRHKSNVYDIAWVSGNAVLASCSEDQLIAIWMVGMSQRVLKPTSLLHGHSSPVYSLARMPTTNIFASGSSRGPILFWDSSLTQVYRNQYPSLRGHTGAVFSVAWASDGEMLASGSEDNTVRLWEPRTGKQANVLEWHTGPVTNVAFSYDDRLLASKSLDGMICLWRTDTWEVVDTIEAPASDAVFAGLAFHPSLPLLATPGERDTLIHIWHLDIPALLGLTPEEPTVHYASAKVVLVGERGVGKTALGMVLVGEPFKPTESSHGRFVRLFDDTVIPIGEGRVQQRETYLWDLAGQSGYRLVHQLYLDKVAAALLVFADNQGSDPLAPVAYWARTLQTALRVQGHHAFPLKKLLVHACIDRGRVRLSRRQIEDEMLRLGMDRYFETSAKEGTGITELREAIEQVIDWSALPSVTSTELFQDIKNFLVTQKEAGYVLLTHNNLYCAFLQTCPPASDDLNRQFDTAIGHLEAQGFIYRFPFGDLILLQPEILDAYAYALVNAVRRSDDEWGSISESNVLDGTFDIPTDVRLKNQGDEKLLLLALVADLVRREITLREKAENGIYLIFPSEVMRQDRRPLDPPNKTIVFTFEGPALNIYATLVVRLSYSTIFSRQELWQNAATFTADVGGICGIILSMPEEGRGQLTLFFDEAASEETRYHFEKYVQVHLERWIDSAGFERQRIFMCPQCMTVFPGRWVEQNKPRAACPFCQQEVDLRDGEERLQRLPESLIPHMDRMANQGLKQEAARSILQGKDSTGDFDVFLCYNEADKSAVRQVGEQLRELGILPWFDEWEAQSGYPWQRLLEQQINQVKAAAVFVGKSGTGPWRQEDKVVFLRDFQRRGCPILPVLLPGTPSQTPQLPLLLEGRAWIDFRQPETDPLSRLVQGISGKRILPLAVEDETEQVDVLLVTVTDVETRALLSQVETFQRRFIGDKTYYDLGEIGSARVWVVRSEMGAVGQGAALLTVEKSIQALSPSAIIMVGIAFGLDPTKQQIGDILVSHQILDYESQRVGEHHIYVRGDRPSASVRLLDRFRDGVINWKTPPDIKFGLLLSGAKLVDNQDFRDQLHQFEPEAIGGEMEGVGLYAAAQSNSVDWIVVKAICDWADGHKDVNKRAYQEQAASNAARFVMHVIKQGGLRKEDRSST